MLRSSSILASRTNALWRGTLPAHASRKLHTTSASCAKNRNLDETENNTAQSGESLFAAENIGKLSPLEVSRMKVAYGLAREHARVVEEGLETLDVADNPMIDPRSFDVRRLPSLPDEVLRAFREELPSSTAATAKPLPTRAVWDEDGESTAEIRGQDVAEWTAVDERTMDPRIFVRMQRQAGRPVEYSSPTSPHTTAKRSCPLSDWRGRVDVDFRAVGKISTFLSDGGKILPRRKSGLSAKAQRKVSRAIKSARHMALLAPDPSAGPTLEELREMYG